MKSIKEILGVENYTELISINNVYSTLILNTPNRSVTKGHQRLTKRYSELIYSKPDSNKLSSDIDKSISAIHKTLSVDNKLHFETSKLISGVDICNSVKYMLISVNNILVSGTSKPSSRCNKEDLESKEFISGLDKSISGSNILSSASNMPIYCINKRCMLFNKRGSDSITEYFGIFKKAYSI